jgi:cell division protein FtsB
MVTDNYLRQRANLLKKENEKLKAENEKLKAKIVFLQNGVEHASNDADYWRARWRELA